MRNIFPCSVCSLPYCFRYKSMIIEQKRSVFRCVLFDNKRSPNNPVKQSWKVWKNTDSLPQWSNVHVNHSHRYQDTVPWHNFSRQIWRQFHDTFVSCQISYCCWLQLIRREIRNICSKTGLWFDHFPKQQILDSSKLKEFADNIFEFN